MAVLNAYRVPYISMIIQADLANDKAYADIFTLKVVKIHKATLFEEIKNT